MNADINAGTEDILSLCQRDVLDYWRHLSSLREPVRELVLANWDEVGRPRNDAPVRQFLVGLCELSAEAKGSFDAFKAEAYEALYGVAKVNDRQLEDYYLMFMNGAIYGMRSVRARLREDALNRPTSDNP